MDTYFLKIDLRQSQVYFVIVLVQPVSLVPIAYIKLGWIIYISTFNKGG